MLVTSGGVSVGPHDLVRRIEAELGVEEVFWGVVGEAGQADLVRRARRRRLVFGLPGNPVSVLVGFELFVRPAVLALQGAARAAAAVRARAPRRRRSRGTRAGTSSYAGASASTTRAVSSSRCPGGSRT